ncbi:hypothetical protein [Streptomyces sp. NBC_01186]|uniref:hypothetical protein n=1 Tax=Streptomyces sp. NBC_01186 TaxID=2903765 RepID=UPI003FA6E927
MPDESMPGRGPRRAGREPGFAGREPERGDVRAPGPRPARHPQPPRFGLALTKRALTKRALTKRAVTKRAVTKRAVSQAEGLMGLHAGLDPAFGLHHVAHAHNAETAADPLRGMEARSMRAAGRENPEARESAPDERG